MDQEVNGQCLDKFLLLLQLLSALGFLRQPCAKSVGLHRDPEWGKGAGLRSSFTFYFIWCVRMCACMCAAHVCAGDTWWLRCVSMLLKKSEASLCCFSGSSALFD